MAQKPSSKPDWTIGNPDFGTVTLEPNSSKKETGWEKEEKPPFQFFNWLFWILDGWIKWFEIPNEAPNQIAFVDSPVAVGLINRTFNINTSAGAVTLNLPTALSAQGLEFIFYKTTLDNNLVTIVPNGAEEINGLPQAIIGGQYGSLKLKSTGTEWVNIGAGSQQKIVEYIDSNTLLLATDSGKVFMIDTIASPIIITLPANLDGIFFTFKDTNGNFGIEPVTIERDNVADTIEGLASDYVLEAPWGSWTLISENGEWKFI